MAWCYYKDLRRKVGARLRVRALSNMIRDAVPRGELLHWVKVDSRADNRATLLLASWPLTWERPAVAATGIVTHRYTITVVTVDEDPKWIVER